MVVYAFKPKTLEAEARRSVGGQSYLHSKFPISLRDIVRLGLKKVQIHDFVLI